MTQQIEPKASIQTFVSQYKLFIELIFVNVQVAYRGENASIPVNIVNAAMRLPASVGYDILTTDGQRPGYIVGNQTSGFLQWDQELGDEMELDVLIDWDLVGYNIEVHRSCL